MRILPSFNKEKIFCVGANKTGTSSVEKALIDLGYKLGHQEHGQDLIAHYKARNFSKIAQFCKSADAFQDAPFSWHYTGIYMDQYFKNAKFILTVRDSPEQWYQSLTRFHSKILGLGGRIPTADNLKEAKRSRNNTMWDNFNARHVIEGSDPYDKERLTKYYNDHNAMVIDYFRFKENLLVINLSHDDAYRKFCKFLEKQPLYDVFPWENKTDE